jgi:Cytochrome P450
MWVSRRVLVPWITQLFSTFFLAMVYPEVQKGAQAELDKVLNGRLPKHSDFTSLPYLLAFFIGML